ncbi:MAG: alpha/beta fold hydrolase [Mycobacteriales bacterium]
MVHHGAVELAVRDYGGAGPAVLLLHGGGRTLVDWALVVPTLARRHRVVAMDLRNHGRSGDGPWDWDVVVADVAAVVAELGLGRPAVVGHSRGGMVAAAYAARGAASRAAVNIDGHGPGRPEQYLGLDPGLVRTRLAELDALARQGAPGDRVLSAQQADAMAEQVGTFAAARGIPAELATEGWRRSLAPLAEGGFRIRPSSEADEEMARSLECYDLFEVYRRVRCPLRIYRTTRTELVAPGLTLPDWVPELLEAYHRGLWRDLRRLAAGHPLVTPRTIDATHWLLLEQPKPLARRLTRFLASEADRPGRPAAGGADPVDPGALVADYYARVDAADVDGLLGLFAPDAVYERPGYPPLVGHAAITDFYRHTRVIATGCHVLTSLVCAGRAAACAGTFRGRLRTGEQVDLRWADFWTLDGRGKVTRRTSFFFAPLV